MRFPRTQLLALLMAVAFVFGWAHCALDLGCVDEASLPAGFHACCCHSPAVSDTKPLVVKPAERPIERIAVSLEPNARLAAVSIFNPPKA
ncbi:MAG: hypothetical protein ACFUZC_22215 [Chthoniobacteraceae bacterium]